MMIIDIQQPELEALIQQRMTSGHFKNVEDLLRQVLETSLPQAPAAGSKRQNLSEFLKESPLWKSGLTVDRATDEPRIPEL